jgi:hypothetical protein
MPFYLYGTAHQQHIDHVLLRAPNIQLSASQVRIGKFEGLNPQDRAWINGLKNGLVAVMEDVYESVIQPLTKGNEPKFFKAGESFRIRIYEERSPVAQNGNESLCDQLTQFERSLKFLAIAKLTLKESVWWDYCNLNRDIGPAELHGDELEHVVFQMRGEKEWRDAYREECRGR